LNTFQKGPLSNSKGTTNRGDKTDLCNKIGHKRTHALQQRCDYRKWLTQFQVGTTTKADARAGSIARQGDLFEAANGPTLTGAPGARASVPNSWSVRRKVMTSSRPNMPMTSLFRMTGNCLGPLLLRPPFTGASVQSFALRLTSPFNLPAPGTRQPLYVVFDFAETCVFVKQSPDAIRCGPSYEGHSFSRSYGANLPSS